MYVWHVPASAGKVYRTAPYRAVLCWAVLLPYRIVP